MATARLHKIRLAWHYLCDYAFLLVCWCVAISRRPLQSKCKENVCLLPLSWLSFGLFVKVSKSVGDKEERSIELTANSTQAAENFGVCFRPTPTATPHGQRTLLQSGNRWLVEIEIVKCNFLMSLRGATFAPWQSRGSAHVNKVTLLCIAMSTESHGFIAMTILYCLKCFNCKSSLFCPVYYDVLDRMTTHCEN